MILTEDIINNLPLSDLPDDYPSDKDLEDMINESLREFDEECDRIDKEYATALDKKLRETPPPNKDDIFDLCNMSVEVLDKGFQRYHPYTLNISHRNPLASTRRFDASKDRYEQTSDLKKVITSTFPISDEQFRIIEDGQELYIAILVAWTDDNVEIIEKAMESQGFIPCQSAEATILQDCENRRWLDIRFEPICPDDVTEEINEKYDNLYYLAPSTIEPDVERAGLIIAKGNSECWCSKAQNFEDDEMSVASIQERANNLYDQVVSESQTDLSPNYTLFKVDLSVVGKSTRFFYDSNEKRLYTKVAIPPFAVIGRRRIIAQGGESK